MALLRVGVEEDVRVLGGEDEHFVTEIEEGFEGGGFARGGAAE